MSVDSVREKFEGTFAMKATGLHNRQNPFDEAAACGAVATKAAPAPQDGTTQKAFDVIVGRLNSFLRHERPQSGLQQQHVFAELRHARVIAEPAFQQRFPQPTLQRFHQRLQFPPRDLSLLKRMPRGEDFFDDAKPPPAHKSAGPAIVDDFLEIAFQMCPANLTTLLRYLAIHVPAITVQDTVDFFAQKKRQAQSVASGMDDKHGDVRRGRCPQPAQLAPKLPTRLVGKLRVRSTDCFQGFLMSGRQSGTDFLLEIRHGPQCHGRGEHGLGNLLNATFADAVAARKVRQRRRQAWPDTVGANLGGYGRMGDLATTRTSAGVGLIFGNFGHHGWQFNGLKAFRLGIVRSSFTRQRSMALSALVRQEMLGAADTLRWQQLL